MLCAVMECQSDARGIAVGRLGVACLVGQAGIAKRRIVGRGVLGCVVGRVGRPAETGGVLSSASMWLAVSYETRVDAPCGYVAGFVRWCVGKSSALARPA